MRIRRLFPRGGAPYELFDASVLLLVFGVVGYVITAPPTSTRETLLSFVFLTHDQLGFLIIGAALVGIATSYVPRWLRIGYVATITLTLYLAANFALGMLFAFDGIRPFMSAVLYAWIARRLIRDYRHARR